MNIQVIYQDNRSGQIDSVKLEDMLKMYELKKFMRSDGWITAEDAHTRGEGGMYDGVERRGLYGLTGEMKYKVVA